MPLAQLIQELNSADVKISLSGETLLVHAPSDEVKAAVMDAINAHRQELISFLQIDEDGYLFDPIYPNEESGPVDLSHAQRRLWVLHQMEGNEAAYNIPLAYTIKGKLNKPALNNAFKALLERHESLRTSFIEVDGLPRQVVMPVEEVTFNMMERDLRNTNDVKEYVSKAANKVFRLDKGPLVEVYLLQTADDTYLLLFTLHHIIADGWSVQILLNELLTFYNCFVNDEPLPFAPLFIQYRDYAIWQLKQLESEHGKKLHQYWTNQFAGELPVLELPADAPRPPETNRQGAFINALMGKDILDGLQEISRNARASLFITLVAAMKTLLCRYTGQTDITLGTPIAGRNNSDLEGQIGFYVNTLALRTRFNKQESFSSLLEKVRKHTLDAYDHQLYPFDLLVDNLSLYRDVSRSPLFDTIIQLQEGNFVQETSTELDQITVSGYDNEYVISKFDLDLNFTVSDKDLFLCITYNKDFYSRERIERMIGHCTQLFRAVIKDPHQPLFALPFLTKDEQQLLSVAYPAKAVIPKDLAGYLAGFSNKGVSDIRLYILDDHHQLVPEGTDGELYIGGNGMKPAVCADELHPADHFIADIFHKGQMLFKTGKICRWLPQGVVSYIGDKNDIQRIHGYQVFAARVSEALQTLEGVAEVVVLLTAPNVLTAFYSGEIVRDAPEWREKLSGKLPAYMIPENYVHLLSFPHTGSGNIDINALRAIPADVKADVTPYAAPANTLEAELAKIWQEVMMKERIGVNDNFFKITGGNSLKATQIVSRMYKLGYKASIRSIFTCPTIRELANLLAATSPVVPKADRSIIPHL
jgi:hypothetical protein